MTKQEGPAVEQGYVFQRLKKGKDSQGWVASLNNEGVILKGVEGDWSTPVPTEDLQTKWKLVGKHISVDGVAKVVSLDQIASAPQIEPERTEEPADPELTEQGVIPVPKVDAAPASVNGDAQPAVSA